MIERILALKSSYKEIEKLEKEIIASKDARTMFLYLYYVNSKNIHFISHLILKTKNYRYIHFLLRSFKITNYSLFLDFILLENNDFRYLFNILYDVDYIDNNYKLKLINRIITLGNEDYIFKAIYYYFVVLQLYDKDLFLKVKLLLENKFSIIIDENNYQLIFENLIRQKNHQKEPEGFSSNFYKGRKDYIPNIIVCHINHTYHGAINHFYNQEDEVSCHYLIRRDGYIKQIISLDDSSWANGTSINDSSDVYYKFATSSLVNTINDNANYFTFSIEHESFDGSLTDEQINSSIQVIREIIKYLKDKYNYDFQVDREHIIGHSEINPIVRPKCPGDKFPFDKIIQALKSN